MQMRRPIVRSAAGLAPECRELTVPMLPDGVACQARRVQRGLQWLQCCQCLLDRGCGSVRRLRDL